MPEPAERPQTRRQETGFDRAFPHESRSVSALRRSILLVCAGNRPLSVRRVTVSVSIVRNSWLTRRRIMSFPVLGIRTQPRTRSEDGPHQAVNAATDILVS